MFSYIFSFFLSFNSGVPSVLSLGWDCEAILTDSGWVDCPRQFVWSCKGIHHSEVGVLMLDPRSLKVLLDCSQRKAKCRAKMRINLPVRKFHLLKRKIFNVLVFFFSFSAGTKMFRLITEIFGMLPTRYIVCQKRQRTKRRWVIMPVPVLAVIRPLQAGNTRWSLFWNLC